MEDAIEVLEGEAPTLAATSVPALRELEGNEIELVKGGFVCGGVCVGGLVVGAITLLGLGIYVGWKDDHNDTVRANQGNQGNNQGKTSQ